MRFRFALKTGLALLSVLAFLLLTVPTPSLHAQGYSGAVPNVTTPASGLVVTYTAGTVTSGGLQTAIVTGTVTVANSMTDCSAPSYASCNFVYWTSGSSLSTTTSLATATVPGNVVVAYVTATAGSVVAVTPASWTPAQPTGSLGSVTDRFFTIPLNQCTFTPTTTAADTGTWPGWTFVAANEMAWSYQTNTTSGTVEITCNITPPPSRTTGSAGMTLTSIDVYYAVVTTTLTTLAAPTVSTVTGPATVGGAAAGTIAAAGGSLTVTPGTLQKTAITSGLMYRQNIVFGTPIAWTGSNAFLTYDQVATTAGAGSTKTRLDIYGIVVYYK